VPIRTSVIVRRSGFHLPKPLYGGLLCRHAKPLHDLFDVLSFTLLLGLRIQHRHIETGVSGGFLGFYRCGTGLLAPGHVQAPEDMHAEALMVDSHSFCRWPEYITLQISVIKGPAIFPAEDVIGLLFAGSVSRQSICQSANLPYSPRRLALWIA